ncbi:MAG: hypothetical protein JWR69_1067, partial [Pedosphaera sp.]|nr:hypothetical protein [Pedosphaera sp.]
ATGIAQSILSLGLGFYVCRHLKIAWLPWALRSWLVPVVAVCAATFGRMFLPFESASNVLLLVGGYAALLLVIAWLVGVRPALIREEWAMVRSFLRRKAS